MHRKIGSGALTESALNADWSFGSRKIVRVRKIGSGALTEGALNVDWSFGSRKIVRVGYIKFQRKTYTCQLQRVCRYLLLVQ